MFRVGPWYLGKWAYHTSLLCSICPGNLFRKMLWSLTTPPWFGSIPEIHARSWNTKIHGQRHLWGVHCKTYQFCRQVSQKPPRCDWKPFPVASGRPSVMWAQRLQMLKATAAESMDKEGQLHITQITRNSNKVYFWSKTKDIHTLHYVIRVSEKKTHYMLFFMKEYTSTFSLPLSCWRKDLPRYMPIFNQFKWNDSLRPESKPV